MSISFNRILCRGRGFTLVEMMMVVFIIAILFSVGVPSFDGLVKRNTVEGLQMKLASAVSTARSEASSRNAVISICPSDNAVSCGGSWSDGWISFEDDDTDGKITAGEVLVDVYEHSSEYTLSAADSAKAAVSQLSFSPQGFMQGSESTLFTICAPNAKLEYARGLFVNSSGLMIKTNDSGDSDTTHDNPFTGDAVDPEDLVCAQA